MRERAWRDRRTLLIAVVSVFAVVLPVVIQADPVAAESLRPGFNLSRTDDVSQFVPSPTNFVFLPGTTNLIGIGKCGDIGLGRMPNADGLASSSTGPADSAHVGPDGR